MENSKDVAANESEVADSRVRIFLFGERGSGRSFLYKGLRAFCRSHRESKSAWLSERLRFAAEQDSCEAGGHFTETCIISWSSGGSNDWKGKFRVHASVVDPGPTSTYDGGGAQATLLRNFGSNTILWAFSLTGVKQVRQRGREPDSRADDSPSTTDSFSSDQVVLHAHDEERLVVALRVLNVCDSHLECRDGDSSACLTMRRLVFVGTHMDGLTDSSPAGARAVLARISSIIDAHRKREGWSLVPSSYVATDLLRDRFCVENGTSNTPIKLFHRQVCLSQVMRNSLDIPSAARAASPKPIHMLQNMKSKGKQGLIVHTDTLRKALFALGYGCGSRVWCHSDLGEMAMRGSVVFWPVDKTPLLADDEVSGYAGLIPSFIVHGLVSIEQVIAACNDNSTRPCGAAAQVLRTLTSKDHALCRHGVLSKRLLSSLADALADDLADNANTGDPAMASKLKWLEKACQLSLLGSRCLVVPDGASKPEPALFCPGIYPHEDHESGLIHSLSSYWMDHVAGAGANDTTLHKEEGEYRIVSALSLQFLSHPPRGLFSAITVALMPLVRGTVFSDALWLVRGHHLDVRRTDGCFVWWDASTASRKDGGRCPSLHLLSVVGNCNDDSSLLSSAELESQFVTCVIGLLETHFPSLTARLVDHKSGVLSNQPSDMATPHTSEKNCTEVHCLPDLIRIFSEPLNGYVFV